MQGEKLMNDLWDKIELSKKGWKIGIIFYLIFNGCFMFPYRMPSDPFFSIYSNVIMPVMINAMIAIVLYGIEKRAYIKTFVLAFICNGVGLLGRIALEWGEYSMTRDLTFSNTIIFLLVTPLLITLIYLLCKYADKN